MRYLDAEEILLIHHLLIDRYGGSHGTRNLERVKSAAVAPAQHAFGQEQYESEFQKAAVYARNIILDHPFVDGNKRTGIATAVMFLKENGHTFKAELGQVEDFAVQIAVGKLDIEYIAKWFESRST